jgi:hypothetical protein
MGHEHILAGSVGKWNPGLVLKVHWDDGTEPAIWVPLADFFGAVTGRSVDCQSTVMLHTFLDARGPGAELSAIWRR